MNRIALGTSVLLAASVLALSGCRIATGPSLEVFPDQRLVEAAPFIGDAAFEAKFAAVASYRPGDDQAPLLLFERLVEEASWQPGLREAMARRIEQAYPGAGSTEARRFLLRQLEVLGSEASIPLAASELFDSELGDHARAILEMNPSPLADQVVRAGLHRARGDRLAGLADTAGNRGDAQAVARLAHVARGRGPAADSALRALGRIGTKEAGEHLLALRGTLRQPASNDAAAWALAECGHRLLAEGDAMAARRFFSALLVGDAPESARTSAVAGLMSSDLESAVPLLVASLEDGRPAPRRAALALMRDAPAGDLDALLASRLLDAGPDLQAGLLALMADRGAREALQEAIALLGAEDPGVRIASANYLGAIQGLAAVPRLLDAATAGDEAATAARNAIDALAPPVVTHMLFNALSDAEVDPGVRVEAASALARRNAVERAAGIFDMIAGEPDLRVRVEMYRALGVLADEALYRRMAAAIATAPEGPDERQLVRATGVAGQRIADQEARVAPLLQGLAAAETSAVRISYLGALGGVGGWRAARATADQLRSPEEAVVDAAVRALADWPDPSAIAHLEGVMLSTDNQTHRALAFRGIARLLRRPDSGQPTARAERAASLIENAERAEELLAALAALTDNPHPAALAVAETLLDREEVREEAFLACMAIIESMRGQYRGHARPAIARLQEKAPTEALAERAEQVRLAVREADGFILDWLVNGPWEPHQTPDPQAWQDHPFPPEIDPASVAWRPRRSNYRIPFYRMEIDLVAEIGGENRAAYLLGHFHVPTAREARFEIGSDDSVRAWLNGAMVHENRVSRGFQPASDIVDVDLAEGWNSVMLRIDQGGGGWGAGLRVVNRDGTPMDDLRLDSTRGGDPGVPVAPPIPSGFEIEGGWRLDLIDRGGDGFAREPILWSPAGERAVLGTARDGLGLSIAGTAHGAEWMIRWSAEEGLAVDSDSHGRLAAREMRWESPTETFGPPDGAIVLLADEPNPLMDAWTSQSWSAGPPRTMRVVTGDNRTRESFGDAFFHIEFMTPLLPTSAHQRRGNSGVYIQDRYELQILDSFGEAPSNDGLGSVYRVAPPSAYAAFPPETWQTYDILFRAPRFGPNGELVEHARLTAFLNGELIHRDLELPAGGTGGAAGMGPVAEAPLRLQEHGDLVRFRNIWAVRMDERIDLQVDSVRDALTQTTRNRAR